MNTTLEIVYVSIDALSASAYNPRKWSKEDKENLKESITRFGQVDPLLVNSTEGRKNIIIGGHMRLECLKELGYTEVAVVYIDISDINLEKELCVRLNKNTGEFDYDLLGKLFDEISLKDFGFSSEELDDLFAEEPTEENFDLEKELDKLGIGEISVKKGDIYELEGSRLMCGDSTVDGE